MYPVLLGFAFGFILVITVTLIKDLATYIKDLNLNQEDKNKLKRRAFWAIIYSLALGGMYIVVMFSIFT